jgi:hypothetical protein
MTHILPRLAIAGLLCTLAALPAFAQAGKAAASKPTDISGRWQFKTELRNKGCTISGEINFKRATPTTPGYSCAFVAREECGSGDTRTWSEVKQSCTVSEAAGEFTILSKVEQVLAAFPAGYKEAIIANDSYRPDNFKVSAAKNGDLVGGFKSINEAAVRFWRDQELVS